MQIDSSSVPQEEDKVDANQMDFFMDAHERQRAATYYKQMQQEIEDRLCKFCDKQITDIDQLLQTEH